MREIKRFEDIPEFATEAEEAEFWANHSLGEALLDRMAPVPKLATVGKREEFRRWWEEALEHVRVSKLLLSKKHWSSSMFHALMAMELAAKAVRAVPLSYGDLEKAPYGQLEEYTYGQLEDGPGPKRSHDLAELLDAPWLRALGSEPLKKLDELLRERFPQGPGTIKELYEACRYPDRWPPEGPAPFRIFTEEDASTTLAAAESLLRGCAERLTEHGLGR